MASASSSPLAAELERFSLPGSMSRSDAEDLFRRTPFEELMQAAASGSVDTALLAGVLRKAFESGAVVPNLRAHAVRALSAQQPDFRSLAIDVLAEEFKGSQPLVPSESGEIAVRLLNCLADPDTAVSTKASECLLQLSRCADGSRAVIDGVVEGRALQALLATRDATVSLRVLSFAAALAGTSPEAAAAVREQALLEPLVDDLSSPGDVLGCLAALQLAAEVATKLGPAAPQMLGDRFLPALAALARSHSIDGVLRAGALKALGAVVAGLQAAGASDVPLATAVGSPETTLQSLVLTLIQDSLGDGAQVDMRSAALEVVGSISATRAGAELLLSSTGLAVLVMEEAFSVTGESRRHVPAMHAAACLLGASRAGDDMGPDLVALAPAAEESARTLVYAAAGSRTPAEILLRRLRQPFAEVAMAAYRLLFALALSLWGARELCRDEQLCGRLCDLASESTEEACEWRFACVQRLARTGQLAIARGQAQGPADPLLAAFPAISAAALQGPYVSGRGGSLAVASDVS